MTEHGKRKVVFEILSKVLYDDGYSLHEGTDEILALFTEKQTS